ncbi:MAG: molecular chaperone DnaK, partial [Methylotenera sp.]|nr:molecular chaperone DnaK [Flavobacterium sp.]
TALEKLKEAHKNQDIAAIDVAMVEMNTAWTAASEDIYKAQADGGATAAQEPSNQGASQAETVTDAEFEEVK